MSKSGVLFRRAVDVRGRHADPPARGDRKRQRAHPMAEGLAATGAPVGNGRGGGSARDPIRHGMAYAPGQGGRLGTQCPGPDRRGDHPASADGRILVTDDAVTGGLGQNRSFVTFLYNALGELRGFTTSAPRRC